MDNLPQKKKQGLPARLTPMQRSFAELLVFNEGHKFAYECAKEAGYEKKIIRNTIYLSVDT